MRLDEVEESSEVEDQRGGGLRPGHYAAGGIGTIVIVIIYSLLGGNPNDLKGALPSQVGSPTQQSPAGVQQPSMCQAYQADAPLQKRPKLQEQQRPA